MTNTLEMLVVPALPGILDMKLSPKILTKEYQIFYGVVAKIQELDEYSRQNLLTFFSTGEFIDACVNGGNVRQYLEIASSLKNKKLFDVCEEVCVQNLYTQNCFSMLNIGTTYDLKRLRCEAVKMIEVNIEDICESDDIQTMGANDLSDLLHDSNIKHSPFAMKAVEHWFVYEKDPRQNHYKNMIEYLQNIQTRFRPMENKRTSHHMYQVMFSLDNKKESSLNVHVYEPSRNLQKSSKLKECKNVGPHYATCCTQDSEQDDPHIYISGGERAPNTVYHCDIIMNKHTKCSKKLNYGRTKHCMAAVGRSIYVIGGTHKGKVVSAVEEFTHKRHSWKVLGQLLYPVHSASCVVYDKELYIIGGVLSNGETTTIIQKFCPKTKESVAMGHLPFCASNTKAVVFNGSIFIAFEDGQLVCYEPYFAITKSCTQLPVGCRDFAMFSERDGIYIVGNLKDKKGNVCGIYRYTQDNNTWQRSETDLKSAMSIRSCCSVKVPPMFNLVPFSTC